MGGFQISTVSSQFLSFEASTGQKTRHAHHKDERGERANMCARMWSRLLNVAQARLLQRRHHFPLIILVIALAVKQCCLAIGQIYVAEKPFACCGSRCMRGLRRTVTAPRRMSWCTSVRNGAWLVFACENVPVSVAIFMTRMRAGETPLTCTNHVNSLLRCR